ncbi:MAG: outer membrane protein assembly factor BamD [Cardiobacteriaceae bacterium]|nr:outer membrane protein assembly factor BamD [Cardiobacteriaceae bacterium]
MPKRIIWVMIAGSLAACSSIKEDRTVGWSADQLYQSAKTEMESSNYRTASEYYTKLLARYPYGQKAQQAALDLAYSYYKAGEADKARAEYEAFIRTYPRHTYIDYAYYMLGVVAYEKDITFYDKLNPTNLAQTDPEAMQAAFNAFAEVVSRYPDSEYAEDARYRMLFLKNLLGQHELEIADYYLRRGAYVAAANRAKNILQRYEQTPSTPYALALMSRAYRELGQTQLAEDALRILKLNFSGQLNDPELRRYLEGNIRTKKNLWEILRSKPKV